MLSKAFRLFTVCLFLVPFSILAETHPAASGCNMTLIDLTDPSLAAALAKLMLVPAGPVTKEYKSSGFSTNTKISRGDFTATDADGNVISISVECALTCSGTACLQRGCEPSGNGCSSWDCGSGCTGSCAQKSVVKDAVGN